MPQDHTFKGPDGDFHYIDWGGSGPLAHFSHATGFCAGLYSPLAERLRPHLQIIGMDDRGHGKTKAWADPEKLANWDIFAGDLIHFFRFLDEPIIAMGHSLGAVVSLLAAVRRPELVRALILIDPTLLPFRWMWLWFLAKKTGLARFAPIVYRAARRRSVWPDRETILAVYRDRYPFKAWEEDFLEAYIDQGTEQTGEGTIRLCCEPAWESRCFFACPHDVWRYVPRLKQPTLIIYGAESDTFLQPAVKRFKAKVPSATFSRFEGTGHFVPMERPEETTKTILDFLMGRQIL